MENGLCNVNDGEFPGDRGRLGGFLTPSTYGRLELVDGERAGRGFNT